MGRKKTTKKSPLVTLLKKNHFVKTEQGGARFFISLSIFFFLLSGLIFADTVSLREYSVNELPEDAFLVNSDGTISKVVNGEMVPVENVATEVE